MAGIRHSLWDVRGVVMDWYALVALMALVANAIELCLHTRPAAETAIRGFSPQVWVNQSAKGGGVRRRSAGVRRVTSPQGDCKVFPRSPGDGEQHANRYDVAERHCGKLASVIFAEKVYSQPSLD
jgi:hypothetical protein